MTLGERRAADAADISQASTDADSPAALCEAGFRHLDAGRYLDAQLCGQRALTLDPSLADGLHLMALLSLQAGHHDLAAEWATRAIAQSAQSRYFITLGTVKHRQGQLEEALKALDRAVQLEPENGACWRHFGVVLVDLNLLDQAVLSFQYALKFDGKDWEAAERCGCALFQLGRPSEAIGYLGLAEQLNPNNAEAAQLHGVALYNLKRYEEALAAMRRAHALEPENADICNNLGVFLQRLGREADAVPWFERAIAIKPKLLAAYTNKAHALGHLHRFDDAIVTYDALEAVDPGNGDASWSRSLVQLLTGNFEAGWAGREARWRASGLSLTRLTSSKPLWLGKEPVAGKTLLVHSDEGLGDTIQFARYAPMLAERGARVILMAPDALCPLLSKLPGVFLCLPLSVATLPAHDLQCPLSSLPLAFATRLDTIPSTTPYLQAPSTEAWEARLGPHDRLRVGLAWSGNAKHREDHYRSIPLAALTPLLDCGARVVSLQKEVRPDDAATLRTRPDIVDLTPHLFNLNETAALVSCLDLVISVDSSMAHLAGALAKPTWILLPYTPDYRWLLDREDSPWYPTARLFRQDASRDYAPVIARVRAELDALIAARGSDAKES
jgi:tetratricopeptide (TPR) repeat protein